MFLLSTLILLVLTANFLYIEDVQNKNNPINFFVIWLLLCLIPIVNIVMCCCMITVFIVRISGIDYENLSNFFRYFNDLPYFINEKIDKL